MTEDLTLKRMFAMQEELQAKYKGKWEPICPATAGNKLLWSIGEMGEVIDIIKKLGDDEIMNNPETRAIFIEEMSDVFMYLVDTMSCYGISASDFADIFVRKHEHNMKRDYIAEHDHMFDDRDGL